MSIAEPPPPVSSRPDTFWEDLAPGETLYGPGVTLTDAHLVGWAGLTGDWVSLHLDEHHAVRSGFAGRIGHGPFTLSLSLGLITQTGALRQVLAWLGLDDVRATAPVLIGDTIRPEAELALARPTSKPDRGVWALTYRVLNQRGESVMTFTSSFLVRRRPATPSPRPNAAARKNGLPSGGGQAGPDAPAP